MTTAIKTLSAAAATAALAMTGVAGAAEAPVVSQQEFIAGHAPLTIPGTGIQKGEWMGGRARLLYRNVTLEGSQQVRVTLRAPKGTKIRGLAIAANTALGFAAETRRYVGKQQVTVRMFAADRGAGEVSGRIYALAK